MDFVNNPLSTRPSVRKGYLIRAISAGSIKPGAAARAPGVFDLLTSLVPEFLCLRVEGGVIVESAQGAAVDWVSARDLAQSRLSNFLCENFHQACFRALDGDEIECSAMTHRGRRWLKVRSEYSGRQTKLIFVRDVSASVRYRRESDRRVTAQHRLAALSPREGEIVGLIAEGRTSPEIASLFGVSLRTIETHRYRLTEKLAVKGIAELVRLWIRAYGDPESNQQASIV